MSDNKLRFKDETGNNYPSHKELLLGEVSSIKTGKKDGNGKEYPEWVEESLENLADWINGFAFKPVHLGDSGITVIKIKELLEPNDLSVKTEITTVPLSNHINDGDIIFSWSMAMAVRKWQSGFAYLNQHLYKVLPKDGVNKDFLLHCLDVNIPDISTLMHGGTAKHITRKDLMPYKVEFPASLEEQHKIACLFSKLDERIELREQKILSLKEYKKGLQQAVFGNNGERTLRFKDGNGKEYPEWVESTLGDVSKIRMGFTPSTKESSNWGGDIVWVAISDLNNSKYIANSKKKITKSGLGNKSLIPAGRLLMSFKLSIGKLAITKTELTTNEAIANFEFVDGIDTNFIYYTLENKDFNNEGIQAVKGKTLNKESLSDLDIEVPCLEEQEKIANLFSKIDNQIELEEQLLQAAKEEKQGLMQRVF